MDNENEGRQPCEVYSRIVGYIRPIDQWNEGKICEYEMRTNFLVDSVKQINIQI
jgi:ribonucleoside-triphosphate reductase